MQYVCFGLFLIYTVTHIHDFDISLRSKCKHIQKNNLSLVYGKYDKSRYLTKLRSVVPYMIFYLC